MKRVECSYSHGVECTDPSKCAGCGWNPEEARRRLEKAKRKERRPMCHAETVAQYKIMKWLEENFHVPSLKRIELVSRDTVRITDRRGEIALVHCGADGAVRLESIDEPA